MSTRPEIIFPLFSALTALDGVGPKIAKNFENLGITRPRDLLFTLPYSGIKRDLVATVQGADFPNVLTVQVTVVSHKAGRTKSAAYRVNVEDQETTFLCRTFRIVNRHWRFTQCNYRKSHGNSMIIIGIYFSML